MRLHELYFANMIKGGSELTDGELKQKIEKVYGSLENFMKRFIGVGSMRGIGWVILYHDKKQDALSIAWVNEHDVGHLAGATPLLVMDVFEHAFMLDYGLKRAEYIEAFRAAIDWSVVASRLA
jgi:Fe-Mn family superoxide dismutase